MHSKCLVLCGWSCNTTWVVFCQCLKSVGYKIFFNYLFIFPLASHQILLWLCQKCLLKQGSPGHALMFFKAPTHKRIKELQDAEMPILCLCRQDSSFVHLLMRVRLLSLLCLHAFVKSLVTLSAVVHLCSLASYQEDLLRLVCARQVDTYARDSLRLCATLHGFARLHLERELPWLCGAAATGRVR